jgi:diacylglycerol kinase
MKVSDRDSSNDQPAVAPHGDGRLVSSFRYALSGIRYVVRSQRNARIHLAISGGVIALGLWLGLSWSEWAIVCVTIALVLMAEMFNTVAETVTDLVTDCYHPLAKLAKDTAAGTVLIAAVISVVVGLLVLGPHLAERLASLLWIIGELFAAA